MELRPSAHLPLSHCEWGLARALGETRLVAGERATLLCEARLARDLPPGYAVEVWRHFVSDMDLPQLEDADAPAYLEVSAPVEARPFVRRGAKVHGPATYFPYRRYVGAALPAGAPAGSRLRFALREVTVQTYSEPLFNLRLTAMEGDQLHGYLGDARFSVRGGAPDHLHVVAPTCAAADEPFDVAVIVRDAWRNKTGAPLADLRLEAGLAAGGRLAHDGVAYDPDRRLHLLRGVRLPAGTHYLTVALADAPEIRGTANPVVVRRSWAQRIYWGDLHQHAYYCDGRGTPETNYLYAHDDACLDFCSVCPHQEFLYRGALLRLPGLPPQTGWEELIRAAEGWNRPGFATILGSEVGSLGRVAAHMNSYYLDAANRPETERLQQRPDHREDDPVIKSYEDYLAELERSTGEFLLLPHAHAGGGPGRYDLPRQPAYQTNVEVVSVHGVFEPFYQHWLAAGHKVGVNGGGDNHIPATGNANPGHHYPNTNGLAAALAPACDRRGIWDAFRTRQTYAVTGNQRVFLEFAGDAAAMGGTAPAGNGAPRRFRLAAAGTAPILSAELLRNNEVIRRWRQPVQERRHLRLTWTDNCCSRREDDSETTGRIELPGGRLALRQVIHRFNRTDWFAEEQGAVRFRANGYSGITRGCLLAVEGQSAEPLQVAVRDVWLGHVFLEETFSLPLTDLSEGCVRELAVPAEERFRQPRFTPDPEEPRFFLRADWVEPAGAPVLDLTWEDEEDGPAFYYVRLEQVDGTLAWSSPVWYEAAPA